jgi:hypothetical protein
MQTCFWFTLIQKQPCFYSKIGMIQILNRLDYYQRSPLRVKQHVLVQNLSGKKPNTLLMVRTEFAAEGPCGPPSQQSASHQSSTKDYPSLQYKLLVLGKHLTRLRWFLFQPKHKLNQTNRSENVFSWRIFFTRKGQIRILRVCVIAYSSSTHRLPDERTPIKAKPLSATSAELVLGLGLGLGLGLHYFLPAPSHASLLLATLLSHNIPFPRVH